MAVPSVVGAVAGGYLSGVIGRQVLLLGIAAVLLYSGIDLLRWEPPARRSRDAQTGGAGELNIRAAVVAGLLIGLLGGIVGLILGTLRMPALLRFVGEAPARAVGTNVAVGLLVGIAGTLGHLPNAPPDLSVIAVGCAASIPGALLGSRLTGRLSERQLVRAVAVILLVVSVTVAVQALA